MVTGKIIVVDDNPAMVRMLTFMLNKRGYETIVAVDGEEALTKIRELKPRLVFLDVMMPKKDGYQVCWEIRNDPTFTHQPYIIMLTARGLAADRKKAEAVGIDEFMTKPFSPSQVEARVQDILDKEVKAKR